MLYSLTSSLFFVYQCGYYLRTTNKFWFKIFMCAYVCCFFASRLCALLMAMHQYQLAQMSILSCIIYVYTWLSCGMGLSRSVLPNVIAGKGCGEWFYIRSPSPKDVYGSEVTGLPINLHRFERENCLYPSESLNTAQKDGWTERRDPTNEGNARCCIAHGRISKNATGADCPVGSGHLWSTPCRQTRKSYHEKKKWMQHSAWSRS